MREISPQMWWVVTGPENVWVDASVKSVWSAESPGDIDIHFPCHSISPSSPRVTAQQSPVIATTCIYRAPNQPYKQQLTSYFLPCNQNHHLILVYLLRASPTAAGAEFPLNASFVFQQQACLWKAR